MIFPISKAKYKIIKTIYEKPNIRISELLKRTKTSQAMGYKYVNELLSAEVILEVSEGKKPILRLLKPNFSEAGKTCFALIEEEKRLDFFNQHKELKGPFTHFKNEVAKFVDTALIFGSFAKGAETESSDIDILVISKDKKSKNKKMIEKAVESCFITLKRKVSVRLITQIQFIEAIRKREEFTIHILNDHVVILNSYNWIDLIATL